MQDISLALDLPTAPVEVRSDPIPIEQAVAILTDNARLHGGAEVSMVPVTLFTRGQDALIKRRDDGFGMSMEDAIRAVERFGQLKPSQGSGQELSIAVANGGQARASPRTT